MLTYYSDKLKLNCAVILISNSKYFFALCVFLLNLKQYFKNFDAIVLYTDGLSNNEINILKQITDNYKPIIIKTYTISEFEKDFVHNKQDASFDNFFLKRFSHLVVTKFKILEFLDYFKKIIFFDTDMIIRGSFDEILNLQYDIAAAINSDTIFERVKRYSINRPNVCKFIENIKNTELEKIYNRSKTVNGGLFIINDTFDYNNAIKEATYFTQEYFKIHPYLFDELLFGYLINILNLKCFHLDRKVYNVLPNDVTQKSKIIHCYSTHKPWNNKYSQIFFYDWVQNYNNYLNKYNGYKSSEVIIYDNIGKEYKNFLQSKDILNNMNFWNKFIFKIINNLPTKKINYTFDISKHYFQFYIDKYPKNLHYEILKKNESIYIALHYETKDIDRNIEKIFYKISDMYNIKRTLKIEINVANNIEDEFLTFIKNTIHLFFHENI